MRTLVLNNLLNITIPGKPIKKDRHRVNLNSSQMWNPSKEDANRIKRFIEERLPEGFEIIPKGVPVVVNITWFYEPVKSQKTKKFMKLIENEDYPYTKKPDRDNLDKFILDCLSKVVFYDDNQVFAGLLVKFYSTNPRTEIEIKW